MYCQAPLPVGTLSQQVTQARCEQHAVSFEATQISYCLSWRTMPLIGYRGKTGRYSRRIVACTLVVRLVNARCFCWLCNYSFLPRLCTS